MPSEQEKSQELWDRVYLSIHKLEVMVKLLDGLAKAMKRFNNNLGKSLEDTNA